MKHRQLQNGPFLSRFPLTGTSLILLLLIYMASLFVPVANLPHPGPVHEPPGFLGTARADGGAIPPLDPRYAQVETSQVALVDMDTGEGYETIDLFIGSVSLFPGNTTIFVPFPLEVHFVSGETTTLGEFKESKDLIKIEDSIKRQNEGFDTFQETMGDLAPLFVAEEIVGFPAGAMMLTVEKIFKGMQPAADIVFPLSVEEHNFEGGTAYIVSSSNAENLEEFLSSLNITVQEDEIEKAIEKYGEYHGVIFQINNTPPVDDYASFASSHPQLIKALSDFVRDIPVVYSYPEGVNYFWVSVPSHSYDSPSYSKLEEEVENLSYEERRDFDRIFRAVYSFGDEKTSGVHLVLRAKTVNGKGYFPLGTASSWDAMGPIEVFFRCEKSVNLEFSDEASSHVSSGFHGGKHVYIYTWYPWSSDGESVPDYDLWATPEKAAMGNVPSQTSASINSVLYNPNVSVFCSVVFLFLFFSVLWGMVFFIVHDFFMSTESFTPGLPATDFFNKHRIASIFVVGSGLTVMAFGVGILLAMIVMFYLFSSAYLEQNKEMIGGESAARERKERLPFPIGGQFEIFLSFLTLTLGAFVFILFMTLKYSTSTSMTWIFLVSFFILFVYTDIIVLKTPFSTRKRKIGAFAGAVFVYVFAAVFMLVFGMLYACCFVPLLFVFTTFF